MPNTSTTERAIDAIRRIVRALHQTTKLLERRFGMSGAQLLVLEQLTDRPAASLADLAERTGTDQSTTSVVVKRLVDRRFVVREPVAGDKRRVQMALTSEGRAVLDKIPASVPARLRSGFAEFSEPDRRTLAGLLDRWLIAAGIRSNTAP